MKFFNQTQFNLGILYPNHKYVVQVISSQSISITQFKPSCYCLMAEWNSKLKLINITYIPNQIPKHLQSQGYYISNKELIVNFKFNSVPYQEIIRINAKIVNE